MPWYREFIKKGHTHCLGINCKLNFDKMHTQKNDTRKKIYTLLWLLYILLVHELWNCINYYFVQCHIVHR